MRLARRTFAVLLIAALLAAATRGQSYEPPATYYATATGTGATLKTQLRTIISNMSGVNYGDARFSAPYTDPNPNGSGQILLIYDRASVSPTWDEAETWNREHIWPVSRLGVSTPSNSTTNISTDQFNLRPAETDLNAFRGSSPFGMDTTMGGYGYQGSYFYPGDPDAGDVARAQFYMATRYSQLSLTDGSPTGTQMGDLSSLINYHFRDAPDAFERRRNHAIYGLAGESSPAISNPYAQNNRNPYVDHPEYVWSVFVDQANDSSLALQGAAPSANGATSLKLNLGRVLVGAPVPAAQPVTIDKSGVDGTYYQVTTTGLATSSVIGRYNAFADGTTDNKVINVGVAANTSMPGVYGGTVTTDNLDITTGGGAGRGANDGNDVVFVDLTVVSHANPSFQKGADANSLVYHFGTVTAGTTAPAFNFSIYNGAETQLAARLDLDSIVGSGDVSMLSTSLAPFSGASGLNTGNLKTFTATLDTSTVGSFGATYTLSFSDEDLPGATALGDMTLTLTGVVEAASVVENGDFDGDGDMDGADFLTWQNGLGATTASLTDGDANGDEVVDAADLEIWSDQFGRGEGAPMHVVPEPTALGLPCVLASAFTAWVRRRRRYSCKSGSMRNLKPTARLARH
jgi:endonuclease I